MSYTLRVRNFQSILDSTLEVRGLTVVTGTNNVGKSALMRAVQGAFTNARGSSFVRHGAEHCRVSLTFEDGKTVEWVKGENDNFYVLDGKVFNKVGQGPPVELERYGIHPLKVSGQTLWPQFAEQLTGVIFLLTQRDASLLAEAISDVTRVGALNDAMREVQGDRRSKAAELKVRTADHKALTEQLGGYAGLDAALLKVKEADRLAERVASTRTALAELGALRDRYAHLLAVAEELAPATAVTVPAPRVAEELVARQKVLAQLRATATAYATRQRFGEFLEGARGVAVPGPAALDKGRKYVAVGAAVRALRARHQELSATAGAFGQYVPRPLPPAPSREPLRRLQEASAYRSRTRALVSEAAALEAAAVEALASHREASAEALELLGELRHCPTCGTNVSATHSH